MPDGYLGYALPLCVVLMQRGFVQSSKDCCTRLNGFIAILCVMLVFAIIGFADYCCTKWLYCSSLRDVGFCNNWLRRLLLHSLKTLKRALCFARFAIIEKIYLKKVVRFIYIFITLFSNRHIVK